MEMGDKEHTSANGCVLDLAVWTSGLVIREPYCSAMS